MKGVKGKRIIQTAGLILAVLLLFGCAGKAAASNRQTAWNADEAKIDEIAVLGTVEELASEKYRGRLAGSEGNELAALYIADHFERLGLEKPQGLEDYLQYYRQPFISLKSKPTLQVADKSGNIFMTFDYVKDFTLRSLAGQTNEIDLQAPLYILENMNDLNKENYDIKDKVLLIPWNLRGSKSFYELVDSVYDCGAAGAIGEYDLRSPMRTYGNLTVTPMLGPWLKKDHCPFINVDSDAFAKLLTAAAEGGSVSYRCSYVRENSKEAANVVGLLPGSDPQLKEEYIIIGAHYDHVGDNMDGTYNPGALDNASGTAAMMEVARVLAQEKTRPRKSVLFIAFNGEEGGLLGSEYYAQHPVYVLDNTVMINLDMVGSAAKLPLKIAGAEGGDQTLKVKLFEYAEALGIDAEKGIEGGSDHVSFAAKGVPSVLLIHEDFVNGYHGPDDKPEDVDKKRLEEVIKLVLHYIDNQAY